MNEELKLISLRISSPDIKVNKLIINFYYFSSK